MEFDVKFIDGEAIISTGNAETYSLNESEVMLANSVIDLLSDSLDSSKICLKPYSTKCATLVYGECNDFLRFRYTKKTKWISICMPHHLLKVYRDDARFSAQKNKKNLHWKAKITSIDDIKEFKDLMIESCVYFDDCN